MSEEESPLNGEEDAAVAAVELRKTGVFGAFSRKFQSLHNVFASPKLTSEETNDSPITRYTARKTKSRKTKKSTDISDLKQEEEQRKLLLNESLTVSERAFIPAKVKAKLIAEKVLPESPFLDSSRGVCLFADISGFTDLGKELRSQYPPLEAASKLANRIGAVLKELTTICVEEFDGDVVKFAGDALLCVWDGNSDEWMLAKAKACAVSMLNSVKKIDAQLDLHGGIAIGALMHIHLGDRKKEKFWYMVTGDAVNRAVNLVGQAKRGTILYELNSRGGLNEDFFGELEILTVNTPTTLLLSSPRKPFSGEIEDEDDGEKVGPLARAYIPHGLKNILMSNMIESGEMRSKVAVLFVTFPSLAMTKEEVKTNTLSLQRKTVLNNTFCHISLILQQSEGEFRDLLFDDKGCVFIAVFGAFAEVEMAELKALKAAKRMNEELLEVNQLKIGLSVGTCFVGLVGNHLRHDMIVMGHEVNMAARYMSQAKEGTILVSPDIRESTKDFFTFSSVPLNFKKEGTQKLASSGSVHRFEMHENDLLQEVVADPNGLAMGFQPLKENRKRGSFYAMYRYVEVIPDSFFQGRKDEVKRIQAHILKSSLLASKPQAVFSSVGFLHAPKGYGKTWLIRELRRKMDGYSFAMGVAFELDVETSLYALSQLLEQLFEIFEGMPKKKASAIVAAWVSAGIKVDYVSLESLLPYLVKLVPDKTAPASSNPGGRRNSGGGGWGVSMRFMSKPLFSSSTSSQSMLDALENGELSGSKSSPFKGKGRAPSLLDDEPFVPPKIGRLKSIVGGGNSNESSSRRLLTSSVARTTEVPPSITKSVAIQEKKLVKGKQELEGLVKFVSSLIALATKEALKVGKKGLVLVLEDIQWLDVASLQVLCEMLQRDLFPPQVYLLCSSRPTLEDEGKKTTNVHALLRTEFRDCCQELKNFSSFEIDVLSRSETDQLVGKLLIKGQGDSVSDEVKDALFDSTGGMPNAIAQVIDLIRSGEGAVYLDPHSNQWRWKIPRNGTKEQGGKAVLAIARQAYVGRIDHLDIETKDFIKIAACVVDSKFRFKLQDIVNVIKRDLENKARNGEKTVGKAPSVEYLSMHLQSAVCGGLLKNRLGLFLTSEEWSFPSQAICDTVLDLVPADRVSEVQATKRSVAGLSMRNLDNLE